jgi:hypothetical protein
VVLSSSPEQEEVSFRHTHLSAFKRSSHTCPLQQDSDYQSHDSSDATPPAKRRVSPARVSAVCSLSNMHCMSLLLSQASEVLDKPAGKRSRGQVSVVGVNIWGVPAVPDIKLKHHCRWMPQAQRRKKKQLQHPRWARVVGSKSCL